MRTTRIEELWKEALQRTQTHPLEPNGFRLLRINPDAGFDIYAGIDASSFVILAIGIRSKPPTVQIDSSSLDYFRQRRLDGSWLMVLRLKQLGLEPVFGRLCQDLADAANEKNDEKALIALFTDRLNLWKRLFQQGPDGLLQIHEIKGLIAELLVLESILNAGNRGLAESVNGWKGPLRADQDFLYSDCAIEVKAISPGVDNIAISSLSQLDAGIDTKLVVVVLRQAVTGEANAISLNTLVAKVESAIVSNPETLGVFRQRLLEACYVEHEFYDRVLFEPVSWTSFDVTESFPKLVAHTVPEGIVAATYAIALDSISCFKDGEGPND